MTLNSVLMTLMPRWSRSNPLALAVLVCLYERPMHPYEVAQTLRLRATVRLLTGGEAAQQLLGHSLSYSLVPSLLWSAGLIALFAPLAVWKLKWT